MIDFMVKSEKTFARRPESNIVKRCCLWNRIYCGGQEYSMIKELICSKVAKFIH